jgi:hypothetical protein
MRIRGLILMWAVVVVTGSAAHAAPGDDEHLSLRSDGRACPIRGGMCFRGGASSTVADASQPTAALAGGAHIPTLRRLGDGAWVLDLDANLRRSAWAGNALFLVYDAEDHEALAQHEVTALYQTRIAAGKTVAARLTLDPEDGFRAEHTYLVRIVQLIDGREVALAEGEIHLR